MASTVSDEQAGNETYQRNHMALIFKEGLSFSGYERNVLQLSDEGRRFHDVSGVSGLDSLTDGRAVVLADFDNDGDRDVFVTAIQQEAHLLYSNNIGQDRHWIRLALQGRSSGRDAFGAVVRYKTGAGVAARVKSGGSGFLAQHDPRLILGLGAHREAEWIEVQWPGGQKQRFGPVAAGSSLLLVEGDTRPAALAAPAGRMATPLSADEALWRKLTLKRREPLPQLQLHSLTDPAATPQLPAGEPLFINLWGTFCGPCRREMPALEQLRPAFEAKGIRLLGLSLDATSDGVAEFARSLGVTYPNYRLEGSDVAKIYTGPVFLPLSILTDAEGRVTDVFSGWSPETERRIRRLLE